MNIYFIVTIIIFYFLWDILTLNKEVNLRVINYKINSKNIKKKPLCSNKRKTVFLFVVVGILIAVITTTKIAATLALIVMWIVNRIIRRKRLKEIKLLDKENEDYWKG